MKIEKMDDKMICVSLGDKTIVAQRGLPAIIEVVKFKHGLTRPGYCKEVRPLIGITPETVSRFRKTTNDLSASHVLKIHRLSGMSISDIYALNLQECLAVAPQNEVISLWPDTIRGYWVTLDGHQARYYRDHVEAFIGTVALVCGETKKAMMVNLGLSVYRVSQQKHLPVIPKPWILKAHLYSGLKLNELEKLEAI